MLVVREGLFMSKLCPSLPSNWTRNLRARHQNFTSTSPSSRRSSCSSPSLPLLVPAFIRCFFRAQVGGVLRFSHSLDCSKNNVKFHFEI